MVLQSENPREKNYAAVNEQVYVKLSSRQFAFEMTAEKMGKQLIVLTEPDLGQMEVIMGGSKKSKDIKFHIIELREVFEEMVIIPEVEKFTKFYKSLYTDEYKKFSGLFAYAMEQRAKK